MTYNRADIRPILVGALAGLAMFGALKTLEAYSAVFQVSEIAADPAKFYGREVSVTGLARGARMREHYLGKGKSARIVSMSLYEPSGTGSHPFGKHYVSVQLAADQLGGLPGEAQSFTVTGQFKEPNLVGSLEPGR